MDSLAFIPFWNLNSITWIEVKPLLKMLHFFPQKKKDKGTKIKNKNKTQ